MRIYSLLLFGIILSASDLLAGDNLKLQISSTKTPKLGLNANGDVVRGEGNEFGVETEVEKIFLLTVNVNDKKRYLSYTGTENDVPKLVLIEKPDANSRWSRYDMLPSSSRLSKDSPAWGKSQFHSAGGPCANRILGFSDDNNVLMLPKAGEWTREFRPLIQEVLWDNLNDGK